MAEKSTYMPDCAYCPYGATKLVPAESAEIAQTDFHAHRASDDLAGSIHVIEMSEVADIIKHATLKAFLYSMKSAAHSTFDGMSIARGRRVCR